MIFRAINKLMFNRPVREYAPTGVNDADLSEFRVGLSSGGHETDITGYEMVLALRPLQLCIAAPIQTTSDVSVTYFEKDRALVYVRLSFLKCFGPGDRFHLFEMKRTRFHRRSILLLYSFYRQVISGKKQIGFRYYLSLAAGFAIPREVILVSVKCGSFESVFPMDLWIFDKKGTFLLGLRNSNKVSEFLRSADLKISVARVPANETGSAYFFGNFHSAAFPDTNSLPYHFYRTSENENLFPAFAQCFAELCYMGFSDAGSHNILILSEIRAHTARFPAKVMAHRHFLFHA